MRKVGIDVSRYQGDIDWDQVKEQIDFAIIRCGFGGNDTQYDDPKYFQNADACTRLNIPFGVYLFSYATNTSEAISEAEHVLRLVRDYKLTYPIYYDVENNSIQKNLSNEQLTSICETFCNKIEASGYYVGIYSNLYWFETKLSSTRLDRYDKWVAQWANKPTYDRLFGMWQYTSDGSINGVTFDELTDNGKKKVLEIASNIDSTIENKFPGYKETISDKASSAFNKASEIIKKGANDLNDFAREKLGEDNYQSIIDAKDELVLYTKNAINFVGDISSSLWSSTKDKLNNWYQNFKNNN